MFSRAFWRKFFWFTGYEAVNPFETLTREIIEATRKKVTKRIIKYDAVIDPSGAFKIAAYAQGKYENNSETLAMLELKNGDSMVILSYCDIEVEPLAYKQFEYSLSNPEFITVVAHEFSTALSRQWKYKEVKLSMVH